MTASGLHEANKNNAKTIAYELIITGMIQGVGFRPLIYRLAHEKNLVGWVKNDCGCVRIHIEGSESDVEQFSYELQNNASMVSLYLLVKNENFLSSPTHVRTKPKRIFLIFETFLFI